MLSFDTAAAIAAAPTNAPIDPALQQLLADRVHDWESIGVLELTHLLIMQPGDTEQDLIDAVAFSPLINPIDGSRFGLSDFNPHHDWLEQHDGWFELLLTFQDAFAFVLFIQDAEGVDPELLAFCRTYSNAEGQ